jgi:hypothetical protein
MAMNTIQTALKSALPNAMEQINRDVRAADDRRGDTIRLEDTKLGDTFIINDPDWSLMGRFMRVNVAKFISMEGTTDRIPLLCLTGDFHGHVLYADKEIEVEPE